MDTVERGFSAAPFNGMLRSVNISIISNKVNEERQTRADGMLNPLPVS